MNIEAKIKNEILKFKKHLKWNILLNVFVIILNVL